MRKIFCGDMETFNNYILVIKFNSSLETRESIVSVQCLINETTTEMVQVLKKDTQVG